ncbi:MAG TPA: hypothetical protein PLD59_14760 [Tepidisphaeraceae bacterium]|nr:hypothetical protein [Tepidisphaeraceae bacterium]
MSAVYNPQSDMMAEIERLEADAREYRKRMDQASRADDQQVLRRQLDEIKQSIARLQARLG